jgi:hypothetical protein
MQSREILSPLKMAAVKKANENILKFDRRRSEGACDTDILAEIITNPASKGVVGIWLDDSQPDGLGVRVIKGDAYFDEAFDGKDDRFDAINCRCPEEAEAMRQVFGEDAAPLH